MVVVEPGQVLPLHAPRPGDLDPALGGAGEPLRVVDVEVGGPAGVVDGDVQEDPRVTPVNRVHELHELLHRGGLRVEHGQRRVDSPETQGGIGAAEAAHAAIGGRGGVDGQQHEDAAAQDPDDEIELRREIAEGPRGRNDGEPRRVQGLHTLPGLRGQGGLPGLVGSELPHEGVVDDVPAAGFGRFDVEGRVGAPGPHRARLPLLEEEALGLEVAHLRQGEPDLEAPVVHSAHGDVEPVPAEGGLLPVDVADDLGARDLRVADVGADPGRSRHPRRDVEGEGDQVAAEEDAAASGGGLLDQAIGLLHDSSISSISQIAFGKKRGQPFPLAKSIKFAKVKS